MTSPAVNSAGDRVETLPAILHRYQAVVNDALRESLASNTLPLYQILRYSMGWSDAHGNPRAATEGKALRPTLCLLACEATGGEVSRALPAAVSLELIHNFSLIHDDIQDRDETRHHRPTAWTVWGEPKALVAGNTLRSLADVYLWRLIGEGMTFEEALKVTSMLTEAYLEMIEGQYLDVSYEGQTDIGLADYLNMISKKTGALIRCALYLGALIGARDEATARAFRDCGRSLGFVFQIRDDVLGIWGDEEATGKPVGADTRRKKITLPFVYAMSQAQGRDLKELLSVYSGSTVGDNEVASVLEVMEKIGAKEYAQNLAEEHCENGRAVPLQRRAGPSCPSRHRGNNALPAGQAALEAVSKLARRGSPEGFPFWLGSGGNPQLPFPPPVSMPHRGRESESMSCLLRILRRACRRNGGQGDGRKGSQNPASPLPLSRRAGTQTKRRVRTKAKARAAENSSRSLG